MSLLPVRHVFVYGTLRRGQERDITCLQPAPRWVGPARVPGVLYCLSAYPGVVLGATTGWVQGEVYEISPELERQLDEIEGVWPQQSAEYCKRELAVQLDDKVYPDAGESDAAAGEIRAEVICIVYEIARERIVEMPVISGGDWVEHCANAALPGR
jgi:gamma-glutamylcyclotransferase (GGCT)/AIG2-like uncharacterized protein YtfP